MSDCPDYDVLLSLSQLFPGRPAEALAHLASCSACAERLRLLTELHQALAVPAAPDPELTGRIMASIHAEAVAEARRSQPAPGRSPARALDGVLAAVAMFFGLLLVGRGAGGPLELVPVAVVAAGIGMAAALAPQLRRLAGGEAA